MRKNLIIILILTSGHLLGQNFSYPLINSKGGDVESFVPSGWALLDSAHGDLNKDGTETWLWLSSTKIA